MARFRLATAEQILSNFMDRPGRGSGKFLILTISLLYRWFTLFGCLTFTSFRRFSSASLGSANGASGFLGDEKSFQSLWSAEPDMRLTKEWRDA
jgi:hypothetical protein